MSDGIVWLASYPKSGNTWFRAFLTNLLRPDEAPASINSLMGGPIASSRPQFEDAVGYHTTDLTPEEIDALRPEVWRHFAREIREGRKPKFRKIHDAYAYLPDGSPMIPPEIIEAVIYLARNPLDVCVSLANHHGHSDFDWLIRRMNIPDFVFPLKRDFGSEQLPIRILSWSGHVRSWLDAPGGRVCALRYEDMALAPEPTFRKAALFLGLKDDAVAVRNAYEACRFEELRRQEEHYGFEEKTVRGQLFFREGKPGAWRTRLTTQQAARLIADHGEMMRQLDYLDERNEPVF